VTDGAGRGQQDSTVVKKEKGTVIFLADVGADSLHTVGNRGMKEKTRAAMAEDIAGSNGRRAPFRSGQEKETIVVVGILGLLLLASEAPGIFHSHGVVD